MCSFSHPTEFGCYYILGSVLGIMIWSKETGKGEPYGAYVVVGSRVDIEKDYKHVRYFLAEVNTRGKLEQCDRVRSNQGKRLQGDQEWRC